MLSPQELAETIAASHPVLVLDAARERVLYQNPACLELIGEMKSGADFDALREADGDGLQELHQTLNSLLRLRTQRGVVPYLVKDTEHPGMVVRVLLDIGELDTELEEIFRGVNSDPLTKALNRRAIMYALVREILRAERGGDPLQLLLLTVDGLDGARGGSGQDAARQYLSRIAELIQSTIRQTDLLGRLDHAEYLLLLPDTDGEGASWVAQRTMNLIKTAAAHWETEGIQVSVAIGLSGLRDGDTPQTLIQRAREGRLRLIPETVGDS